MTSEGKSFLTQNFIGSQTLSQVWMEETHSQKYENEHIYLPFLDVLLQKNWNQQRKAGGDQRNRDHHTEEGEGKASGGSCATAIAWAAVHPPASGLCPAFFILSFQDSHQSRSLLPILVFLNIFSLLLPFFLIFCFLWDFSTLLFPTFLVYHIEHFWGLLARAPFS